ncbi:CoA ester lyase [Burkholderia sp. Bp8963]|uniref:HpcH/HpaI aldolase/citrate lyase family protein n=1 Tax=Burkholderia sp. Bp8963 TaxID=2184547 RepID=UPI000F59C437|nr:CoA ester lyase [Burkholderia sp. Bp8963]RQS67020.1 CoA ester lyase [Burkholderia sp. Bp8963]
MMSSARPRRSAIYLPANNARLLDKARSLPCDVVILDLEDMVGPDAKPDARAAAVDAVRQGDFGRREVVIRVNGLNTQWGMQDLAAAALARPDAVLVPKISSPVDLETARAVLGETIPLWAMIETAIAIVRLDAIGAASAANGVGAWVIGSNDLASDIRCAHDVERPGLRTALSMSVMAARAYGLAILDGVFNDLTNPDGLAIQCDQAAALGFDGKTVIHPNQIDATNRAFSPGDAALARARAIVAAFDAPENAGQSVLKVDGHWVEHMHYGDAVRLMRVAEAIRAVRRQAD